MPLPIAPTLDLYQFAQRHNVTVFFISGRPQTPEIASATSKNLRKAGYENWKALILYPLQDESLTIAKFKSQARKLIQEQGYDIVLNIGDQKSDLEGGYAETAILVPNPFYHIS